MTSSNPATGTILRVLRTALHTGFAVLLSIATVRVFATAGPGPTSYLAGTGAVLLAAVYTAGALSSHLQRHRHLAITWLAVVTALWAGLLVLSSDFSWLAFLLFFLHLHLLRRRWHAVLAVAVQTLVVVIAQIMHAGEWGISMIIGPVLGALVAICIAWGYAALYAESEQRRRLIQDLTHTRAELASSQHQAGVAAERERLAREIHDTLAQGLSSIILLLRAADTALPEGADTSRGHVTEAHRVASDNLAEARRFVRDLSPPSLSTQSLPQALHRLCRTTARETGMTCELRLDGEATPLPSDDEVTLLRAAQASLANVTSHAHADTSVVTLGFLDTEVTLDIYDNGVGFEPHTVTDTTRQAADSGTGYGLPALRDRIEGLGGRLDVESAPGEGTAVAIRLPLTREDKEE